VCIPNAPFPITVACVDDNENVGEALEILIRDQNDIEWMGWLPNPADLPSFVDQHKPTILLLDLDIPGYDSLAAAAALADNAPDTRIIVLSGHVREELVDEALAAGTWGYVSKNDGEQLLLDAIRRVAAGEFVLSPEARATFDQKSG